MVTYIKAKQIIIGVKQKNMTGSSEMMSTLCTICLPLKQIYHRISNEPPKNQWIANFSHCTLHHDIPHHHTALYDRKKHLNKKYLKQSSSSKLKQYLFTIISVLIKCCNYVRIFCNQTRSCSLLLSFGNSTVKFTLT